MFNENEINYNIPNQFWIENENQNPEQELKEIISNNNILNFKKELLNSELNNQILSPIGSTPNLNNQINNIPEKEKEEENKDEGTSSNKGNESEKNKNLEEVQKYSKNKKERKTFECKLCNKRYLSYPALYTHNKIKHNISSTGKRGRPSKKEMLEIETEKNKYNPINLTYFKKEERAGKTNLNEIDNCINIAFSELYSKEYKSRNDLREMKFYFSVEQHPFLNKFKNYVHDINQKKKNNQETADKVLMQYLFTLSEFCNPEYFTKLIKFVTLFREHVNIFNAKVNENNNAIQKEYTEINDAEDVPNSSNEFITDFLQPDIKNEDFSFSKEESIDLTQNLCLWMFDNNFSCSKISLIKKEK